MSNIKASDVKALRERTGAAMMACKKALVETGNDIEKAIDFLRQAGEAKAAKCASRVAAEGRVAIAASDDGKKAVLIEVNSETDFVGRDENFTAFVTAVAKTALENECASVEQLLTLADPDGNGTIEERRQQLISKIGENINIRRVLLKQSDHSIGHYCHRDRIGVLVMLDTDNQDLARDIALHIAAINPQAISSEQVSEDVISRERNVLIEQAKASGKSQEIAEKMVAGRMKKFLREISLVDQDFVKDPEQSIGDMLKAAGGNVTEFVRFELGEGIEKEEVDFAQEVMGQIKGNE